MVCLVVSFSLLTDFQLLPLEGCSSLGHRCTSTCKRGVRAAESSRKEARNAQPPWALLLAPLPFPTGRFDCSVYLLLLPPLLFSPFPQPFGQPSLRFCCRRATDAHASPWWSREGARYVCIFNVVRPAHLLLRRRRESVRSSKQAAGRKTFSMRNKGGDPEPSCSQRWWIRGHLGSLEHPKPKQFLINESCLFNLVQVLFKITPVD